VAVLANNAPGKRGLTLIEMLTVLFVVSILVAFVTGTARYASRAAETRRAEADLHLLADALERYYLRFGKYPPDEPEDYLATDLLGHTEPLPGNPGDFYAFSNSLPRTFTALDPWGESYRYVRHVSVNDVNDVNHVNDSIETFTLYSLGPDRKEPGTAPDTPDDNIRL
jgi:prepilin-type N-terminal cleavage/methylation domain-containing protein